MDKNSPAAELERFLNFVDACSQEYKNAYDKVNEEDRRVQDFLHQMEFAKDQAERNRVATKLQRSRRSRMTAAVCWRSGAVPAAERQ